MPDDPPAPSARSNGHVPPPADLADLWVQGYGQVRLAEHYGTTRHRVRRWLSELGLQGARRPPGGSSKLPGHGWPPSKDDLRRLCETHNISEIARICHVSRNSVRYWLNQYGIQRWVDRVDPRPRPFEPVPPPPRDELVTLVVEQGRNSEDLARHYQVSASTIRKWVDRYGIQVPPNAYLQSPTYRAYMARRRAPIATPPPPPSDAAEEQA